MVDARDVHLVDRRQVGGDVRRVAGLDAEVELLSQTVGELVDEIHDVVLRGPRHPALDAVPELVEHVEVALDGVGDPGSLDLDNDLVAAAEPGAVRLADGRRRDRLPVEVLEHLIDGAPQLRLQQLLDIGPRRGRDAVLEPRQLGHHRGRHDVGSRRHDLPELHEHAAGLLEGAADADRQRRPALAGVVVGDAQRAPEPVTGGDARDLGVAPQPLGGTANGATRPRDRHQAVLRPGQRARLGQHLDPDRRRHGEEGREQPEVAGESGVAVLVVAGHDDGQGGARDPADDRRQQRDAERAPRPEQAAGDEGDDDDAQQRGDEAPSRQQVRDRRNPTRFS